MGFLSDDAWAEYCKKTDALLKRGVQVDDVLICDEGAKPKPHHVTGKMHVRVSYNCVIDGTGPRYFVHGCPRGIVAYVPEYSADNVIPAGTKLVVRKKFKSSVLLLTAKKGAN